MERLNFIINDLIVSNEFDLIVPVIKADLLRLVRDQYLAEFLTSIEQLSMQQNVTFHLPFVHFHKKLVDIENYLQGLFETFQNQYQIKLFDIKEFLSQLPYTAVRQQLLHTTNIVKSTFYTKFIDVFEHFLASYASQNARSACAELIKGKRMFAKFSAQSEIEFFSYLIRCSIIIINFRKIFLNIRNSIARTKRTISNNSFYSVNRWISVTMN